MRRAWAVAVFAVGLLALSAVLAMSDSSDATPYGFKGYVKNDGNPFEDPTATVTITEVDGSSGSYECLITHKAEGIKDGEFTFEPFEVDSTKEYLINIQAKGYTISNLPSGLFFLDHEKYTVLDDEKDVGGYLINMSAILGGEEDYVLLSGDLETVSTFSVAPSESHSLSGTISAGDFKIIGAKVELIDVRDGYEITVEKYTNKEGKYEISFKSGTYKLRVTADGYKTQEMSVELREGDETIDIDDMEAVKGTDIPRTLMYVAAIAGIIMIVSSVIYRMHLKKNPDISIVYDDDE